MLTIMMLLAATTMAPAPSQTPKSQSDVTVQSDGKATSLQLPMPMNYKAWESMSPELKRIYAAATVDALKWSYLFNDCSPMTPEAMIKGIDQGNHKDPVMIAVASTAYELCQN